MSVKIKEKKMVNRPEQPKVLLHESHFLCEVNLPQED